MKLNNQSPLKDVVDIEFLKKVLTELEEVANLKGHIVDKDNKYLTNHTGHVNYVM